MRAESGIEAWDYSGDAKLFVALSQLFLIARNPNFGVRSCLVANFSQDYTNGPLF